MSLLNDHERMDRYSVLDELQAFAQDGSDDWDLAAVFLYYVKTWEPSYAEIDELVTYWENGE